MNQIMQNKLMEKDLPSITLISEPNTYAQFDFLMHIFAQDKYFRLIQDNKLMNFRKDVLYALSCSTEEFLNFAVNHRNFVYSECAYEMAAKLFAEEIEFMLKNSAPYSRGVIVPVYFGKGNEYTIHVNFAFVQKYMIISQINFIGKEIDSVQRYQDLLFI